MKKLVLLLLVTLLSGVANARQLTVEEALGRARSGARYAVRNGSDMESYQLQHTVKVGATNAVYVMGGEQGFMLLSADDCAAPVLGYSDEGAFDYENAPENFKWWVNEYARQIEYGVKHGAQPYVEVVNPRANVTPIVTSLVKTKWNQGSPYNDMAPKDTNGQKCYTGCVATAMAQVMKYHNWPDVGVGSHSYTWKKTTLSANFGATEYDWDNMLNTYKSTSSAESKAAVAELMYHCGVSVNMSFGSNASGASSYAPASPLVNYFKYDKGLSIRQRDYYSLWEWHELLRNEINNQRPVYYEGVTAEYSGHAFVLDGIKEQKGETYFHVNWGWGGMSDGLFLVTALDPDQHGAGGGESGFNYMQGMIIGVKKAEAGSLPSGHFYAAGDFSMIDNQKTVNLGQDVNFGFKNGYGNGFYSYAPVKVTYNLGVQIMNVETGETSFLIYPEPVEIEPMYGFSSFSVKVNNIGNGTYKVTPMSKVVGRDNWERIRVELGRRQSITMVVSGGKATFTNTAPETENLTITDFVVPTEMLVGDNVTPIIKFLNNEDVQCAKDIEVCLVDEHRDNFLTVYEGQINVLPYSQLTFTPTFVVPNVGKGKYSLIVFDKDDEELGESEIFNVSARSVADLSLAMMPVFSDPDHVDINNVVFDLYISATGGDSHDNIAVDIYKGEKTALVETITQVVDIAEGTTQKYTIHPQNITETGDYMVEVCTMGSDSQHVLMMPEVNNDYEFTVVDNSAVNAVTLRADEHVEVFNTHGMKVYEGQVSGIPQSLSRGLYVVKTASGVMKQVR